MPFVFVDLEKVYEKVSTEELWYFMRNAALAGMFDMVVQDTKTAGQWFFRR